MNCTGETKEIVVDFRRTRPQHAPLTINGATVERLSSTKFLGVHITEDLSWTINTTSLAKKTNQRLYFQETWKPSCAPLLTSGITVWYEACLLRVLPEEDLQFIVRGAEKIVGASLPSLQDIYTSRLTRKALCITLGTPPTRHTASSACCHQEGACVGQDQQTEGRLLVQQAVRMLNSLPALPPFQELSMNTAHLVKKAQQRLFFLRKLKHVLDSPLSS
ncbi:hypothetical protein L3Q82_003304 [Scortum barcoo]|uniref:Uncharacterized protein n=1 Tax=Scortum barcoo TaxID=214431 RepID=A0ACB8VQ85_9TELE|nr:hypothetical protein L3Q82_003304 [Scortum barcoo]